MGFVASNLGSEGRGAVRSSGISVGVVVSLRGSVGLVRRFLGSSECLSLGYLRGDRVISLGLVHLEGDRAWFLTGDGLEGEQGWLS